MQQKMKTGAGERVQLLKVLATLADDLGSFPAPT